MRGVRKGGATRLKRSAIPINHFGPPLGASAFAVVVVLQYKYSTGLGLLHLDWGGERGNELLTFECVLVRSSI